ncbi:MAG TPA: molybdopterin dinucleotide binding domain-containing protein [Candidatus Binatia bacterium]|nr:molybdopterin dinucleotide binding domain-containing protein [Candidatus Binatia bacterium]
MTSLGVAERLAVPGFGADGLGSGMALAHPDDYYLRAVANLAFGERPDGSQTLPDADAREIELFGQARRHLPGTVFDPDRWKAIVGERMWPKVVYVLNRGGRFQDHARGYRGEMVANAYGKLLNLYQEKTAGTIHAGTGAAYPGYATDVPVQDFGGRTTEALRRGHDLALITHRTISQTKSRTIANPWLTPLMPDNGLLISPADAARLGLREGQMVRVSSATNPRGEWPLTATERKPMVGRLVVTRTVRPGVVSFALGFGHWATGAADVTIDGHLIKGERRRQAGLHANAAMWTDPLVSNTCMFDPIGGSVSFYDTYVRLEPVAG